MNIWNPADEKVDDIIGKMLSELHQIDQIFYHWSWYIFPRVLEFYSDPFTKLRFLFKYGIDINATDHSWDNLVDCPTKISLSRRPRPIIQLIFRTGLYYSFDHSAWIGLIQKLQIRDTKENGFLDQFWNQFEFKLPIKGGMNSPINGNESFLKEQVNLTSIEKPSSTPLHCEQYLLR